MFTFKKSDPENLNSRHNICNVYGDEMPEKHSLFIGQVLTLFGDADYFTEDYENICSWVVSAEDETGNVIYLDIYHGPSGPAIGGNDGEDYEKAAEELAELIMSAEPTDYHWEGLYEDVPVTIEMGVKDGVPYYNSEMGEDFEDFL